MRSPVDNRSPTSYRLLPREQRIGTGIGRRHQALMGRRAQAANFSRRAGRPMEWAVSQADRRLGLGDAINLC